MEVGPRDPVGQRERAAIDAAAIIADTGQRRQRVVVQRVEPHAQAPSTGWQPRDAHLQGGRGNRRDLDIGMPVGPAVEGQLLAALLDGLATEAGRDGFEQAELVADAGAACEHLVAVGSA